MGLYLLAHSYTRWTCWMGCAPPLLTLVPKGVPKILTQVKVMGLCPGLMEGSPPPYPGPSWGISHHAAYTVPLGE